MDIARLPLWKVFSASYTDHLFRYLLLGELTCMTVMNVLGHCGFEILPRGFAKHWLTRGHNTTTHHDMHHRYVRHNYGLYFNLWDRIMRTNHRAHEAEFERLKLQAAETPPEVSLQAEGGRSRRDFNPSHSSTPAERCDQSTAGKGGRPGGLTAQSPRRGRAPDWDWLR